LIAAPSILLKVPPIVESAGEELPHPEEDVIHDPLFVLLVDSDTFCAELHQPLFAIHGR
jgi:hypothetical protein